jgi:hypothetical protein
MEYDRAKATQILERTPATLEALLVGLSEEWLDGTDGPDTWSPRQVVAHLLGAERAAWIPRLRMILDFGEGRPLPAFDRVAEISASGRKPIGELIAEFAEQRRDSLGVLSRLPLDGPTLSKAGTHPEFGRVELRQLLATWTVHDLAHLVQIERTMAKQYADAVGPWRTYLRVVRD